MATNAIQDTLRIPSAGDPISAREYGKLVRAAASGQFGRNVILTPHGTYARQSNVAQPSIIELFTMRIKGISGDYLQCRKWDGENEIEPTTNYIVAKPWLLRRTPFDGLMRNGYSYIYTSNVQRVSSKPNLEDETQVTIPNYVVDDEILVVRGPTTVLFDGEYLEYMELSPIRVWASIESAS